MNVVPAFNELMWPVITALKSLGGSATNEELLAKVSSLMNLSPDVQAVLHSDGRQSKVSYNLAWAKTYMKKAGLLENSTRGVWTLTQDGEACDEEAIGAVPARVRKMGLESRKPEEREGDAIEPTVVDGEVVELSEPYWKDRLLGALKTLPSDAFERLTQRLLREAGFIKVDVTWEER